MTTAGSSVDESNRVNFNARENVLNLLVLSDFSNSKQIAEQYLETLKHDTSLNVEVLGFTQEEFPEFQLDDPFTIFVFDDELELELVTNDALIYPVRFGDEIVGILEAKYAADYDDYYFTFGRAYGEEINNIKQQDIFDPAELLVIARMGSKLFATNGVDTIIIFDRDFTQTENTDALIFASASIIIEKAAAACIDEAK